MRFKLGLKAWTTNLLLIHQAEKAYTNGSLDYIELFYIPGSLEGYSDKWAKLDLPFIVHAPHSMTGLNFSLPEMEKENIKLAEESFRLADKVHAEMVIFHPGIEGSIDETVHQMKLCRDSRMVIENKPSLALNGSHCIGSTPTEISLLCRLLDIGFCLDFGHSVASANSNHVDPMDMVREFAEMQPRMYHMTDGDYSSQFDKHEMYGTGSFPLIDFANLITSGSYVTNEAKRKNSDNIDDYLQDRYWLISKLNSMK